MNFSLSLIMIELEELEGGNIGAALVSALSRGPLARRGRVFGAGSGVSVSVTAHCGRITALSRFSRVVASWHSRFARSFRWVIGVFGVRWSRSLSRSSADILSPRGCYSLCVGSVLFVADSISASVSHFLGVSLSRVVCRSRASCGWVSRRFTELGLSVGVWRVVVSLSARALSCDLLSVRSSLRPVVLLCFLRCSSVSAPFVRRFFLLSIIARMIVNNYF